MASRLRPQHSLAWWTIATSLRVFKVRPPAKALPTTTRLASTISFSGIQVSTRPAPTCGLIPMLASALSGALALPLQLQRLKETASRHPHPRSQAWLVTATSLPVFKVQPLAKASPTTTRSVWRTSSSGILASTRPAPTFGSIPMLALVSSGEAQTHLRQRRHLPETALQRLRPRSQAWSATVTSLPVSRAQQRVRVSQTITRSALQTSSSGTLASTRIVPTSGSTRMLVSVSSAEVVPLHQQPQHPDLVTE